MRAVLIMAITGLMLPLPAAAAGQDGSVPWPLGRPPSTPELRQLVDQAVELADQERFEEFLEAREAGEDSEHIFITQERIDSRFFDLERLFQFGDALFEHAFRGRDGYGDRPLPALSRVHHGNRGGLDTYSCAGCHSLGGPDGAGAFTQSAFTEGDGTRFSSARQRNPPALLGLGFVQALAAEMTTELQAQRDGAVRQAAGGDTAVTVKLTAKGVGFGTLTVAADGELDLSEVAGVSSDLVVRPFGWKGDVSRLRRFVENAALIHFGIQAHTLTLRHRVTPDVERLGHGKHWYDPDGDGVQRELEEGSLTATAVYLAMLETPVILPPRDARLLERWARGDALFDSTGCSTCHRRTLLLYRNQWQEAPDTTGAEPLTVHLLKDGETPRGGPEVALFSDLRRHDMGSGLADPGPGRPPEGGAGPIAAAEFLTRPLWGLAETAPYLHDGRAATIPDAIRGHGGEAAFSRQAYETLLPDHRADLHIFLLSLTRQPKVRVPR